MVGDRLKLSTSSQFIDTAENISRESTALRRIYVSRSDGFGGCLAIPSFLGTARRRRRRSRFMGRRAKGTRQSRPARSAGPKGQFDGAHWMERRSARPRGCYRTRRDLTVGHRCLLQAVLMSK